MSAACVCLAWFKKGEGNTGSSEPSLYGLLSACYNMEVGLEQAQGKKMHFT